MIQVIITSYKEPKATLRATRIILKNKMKDLKVIVVDPFPDVENFLKQEIKDSRFEFILDPGMGKSDALNMIFQTFFSQNKNDILVFTDGDVYLSENSIKEISEAFKDKNIGAVTGQPTPTNSSDTKFGYWAHVACQGIDNVRKRLSSEKKFFQASGYLFAVRNGLIKEIPIDVPEDCVIPYLVWKQGYKIKYLPNAKVYVQYPTNWKDWLNQRSRTIKAHENINTFLPDMPRTKSFFNEIREGLFFTLKHPRNFKQAYWMLRLYFARLYMYYVAFIERKKNKAFNPAWRDDEVKSAKPLD